MNGRSGQVISCPRRLQASLRHVLNLLILIVNIGRRGLTGPRRCSGCLLALPLSVLLPFSQIIFSFFFAAFLGEALFFLFFLASLSQVTINLGGLFVLLLGLLMFQFFLLAELLAIALDLLVEASLFLELPLLLLLYTPFT